MDSGISALIGAIIGSATGCVISYFQFKAEKTRMKNQRLFEAKSHAYQDVLTLFNKTLHERKKGKQFPKLDSEEDETRVHMVVSPLILFGSDELIKKSHKLISFFSQTVKDGEKKIKEEEQMILAIQEIVSEMKNELELN